MPNVLKPTAVVELTAAFVTYYTTPALTIFSVAVLALSNSTASAKTVRVCAVPTAGSPTADNQIVWDLSIPANDFIEFGRGRMLPAGTMIQALASAIDSVTLSISGVETS